MTPDVAAKRDFFTYEDYRNFPENFRCEIIGGEIYDMTPAPSITHQDVVREITGRLWLYLRESASPCRAYNAPTDVVFSKENIVQPDILIVCDPTKIKRKGIFGAPDVIFEVISTGTEIKDRKTKRDLFERHGVKEYFLVHPEQKFVEKYTLDTHALKYSKPDLYEEKDTFRIDTVGLEILVQDLFPFQIIQAAEES